MKTVGKVLSAFQVIALLLMAAVPADAFADELSAPAETTESESSVEAAPAADSSTSGACSINERGGRQIFNLFSKLYSNRSENDAVSSVIPVDLPAGEYRVLVETRDAYASRVEAVQSNESARISFLRGMALGDGVDITTTGNTPDLKDSTDSDTVLYDETITLNENARGLVASHAAFPDASSSNDFEVVCIAIDTLENGERSSQNLNAASASPIAQDDFFTFKPNEKRTINVFANNGSGPDSDPDGDTFHITGNFTPSAGTYENLNETTGTLDYTAPDREGTFKFDYTITDDVDGISTATVTIVVDDPVVDSQNPTVGDDEAQICANETKLLHVLANDSDPQGQALSIVAPGFAAGYGNGTVRVVSQGGVDHLEYVPTPNWTGSTVLVYSAEDTQGNRSRQASVRIDVGTCGDGAGSAPIARNDNFTFRPGETRTINVFANNGSGPDSDPDGDTFHITGNFTPKIGTYRNLNEATGTIEYTAPNHEGKDEFDYTITDDVDGISTATVTIVVDDPVVDSQNPIVNDDEARICANETKLLHVLANDSDPQGQALTIASFGFAPGYGNGIAAVEVVGGIEHLKFTPTKDWVGSTVLVYSAEDTQGNISVRQAFVRIDVGTCGGGDDDDDGAAPDARNDFFRFRPGETRIINIFAENGSGPDSDPDNDPFHITGNFTPAAGTYTILDRALGLVSYTAPNTEVDDKFDYTITDDKDGIDTATVTIEVRRAADQFCVLDLRGNGNESLTVLPKAAIDLTWALSGTFDTSKQLTASWGGPFSSANVNGSSRVFASENEGSYTYTLNGVSPTGNPCFDTVQVKVDDGNNEGPQECRVSLTSNGKESLTVRPGAEIMLDWSSDRTLGALIGTGSWSDNNLAASGTRRVNASNTEGTYRYELEGKNSSGQKCTDVLTVIVDDGDNGGDDDDDDDDSNGGGRGGRGRLNLKITNEKVKKSSSECAIVTWNTNLRATSRVVYGTDSRKADDDDDNYGYPRTTREFDRDTKSHEVEICGLDFKKEWYFRPVSDHPRTPEEVGKEVNLKPGKATVVTRRECTLRLEDYLRIDFNNNKVEVIKLQLFLKAYQGENLKINGVFDRATDAAVRRFQVKYNDDVLNPWGYEDDESTGYVYITTKKKINEFLCGPDDVLTSAQYREIASFQMYMNDLERRGIDYAGPLVDGPFPWQPEYKALKSGSHTIPGYSYKPAAPVAPKVAEYGSRERELEARGVPATVHVEEPEVVVATSTVVATVDSETRDFLNDIAEGGTSTDDSLEEDKGKGVSDKVASALFAGVDGIMGVILSVPFLLLVLGILVGLLIIEIVRSRKNK